MGFIPGARPFLYLNPPTVTLACLSDVRLCSLISACGANALGNPLLRLGLPRRFDSLWTRVAPWALAEKKTGVRPNGLGSDRRMGWIFLCQAAADIRATPRPCSRRPSTSTRAREQLPRSPCSCGSRARASNPVSGPASSRPWSHVSWRRGRGIAPWRGPSNAGWR